jgi:predicted DNA-binding transcriptional regulator AlpA
MAAAASTEAVTTTARPAPNPKHPDAPIGHLALRLDEVARSLGVSRRAIERERAAGRFPKPDLTIGRMPLWRPETVRAWLDDRSRTPRGQGGGR